MSNTDPNIIVLKDVRLSYAYLHKPRQQDDGKLRFQCTFLLKKVEHKDLIAKLEKQIERVALDKFGKKTKITTCLHDGNEVAETEGYGDEVMFIRAWSDTKPVLKDTDMSDLEAVSGRPYSGCYVNASIRLFAWSNAKKGNGVSAGLRVVQFLRDGESFGAGPVSAEDDGFEPVTATEDSRL